MNKHHVVIPSTSTNYYQQSPVSKHKHEQSNVSYNSVSTKVNDDTMIDGISSINDLNQNSVSMNNNDEHHNVSLRYLTSTLNDDIIINNEHSLECIIDDNMDGIDGIDGIDGLQNQVDKKLIRNNKICPNKPLPKIIQQRSDNSSINVNENEENTNHHKITSIV